MGIMANNRTKLKLCTLTLTAFLITIPRLAIPAQPNLLAQQPAQNAAEASYNQGFELFQQGTAESLRAAIPEFEKAATLYEQDQNQAGQAIALLGLGRVHDLLGEKQKALEFYNQALPLFQAVGDSPEERLRQRLGEATTLNNIGLVYDALGDKQKALEFYNQALPLFQAVGDSPEERLSQRSGEAVTFNNIGKVYSDLGEMQKALEFYNQALPLSRAVGNRSGEATTLTGIGKVYSALGEMQKALEFYNQALPLFQAVGGSGEATTLNNIGSVYSALGEKQKALEFYNQALPLFQAVGGSGEATTLIGIGSVYSALGEKQKALEFYNQALSLSRAVGDHSGEAATLNNIGLVYSDLGEKQKALEFLNQALPLRRAVGDRLGEAITLNNIGLVYSDLGEKQKALEFYNQALPLFQAVGDRLGEATTLNNIGNVYFALGEQQKALEFYNQALPLFQAVENRSGEATTLTGIGAVYDALGEKQKALEFYNQALPILRAVGNRSMEATTLSNIGLVYDALGEKQKALEFYNQALPLSRAVGDRSGEATTLNNIGAVYDALGEQQKALEFYNQALPLFQAVGDRSGEAATLYNFANLERDRGNFQGALTQIQGAIEIVEALRREIGSQELRASYFATVQDYYEFYIDLLMQLHPQNPGQGFDARALHISERSKARTLLELLQEASADIREGAEPQLLTQEKLLQQKLDAVEKRRLELFSQGNPPEEQQFRLDQEQNTLTAEYQELQARIRTTSPKYAALTQPEPLTLEQIQQQVLDEETVLLQYALGETRSYLWVVGKNSFASYELAPAADIKTAVRDFTTALRDSRATASAELRAARTAEDLSQLILQPIGGQLPGKRLLIVADGALQYIPFAALAQPGSSDYQPLILTHEIINSPSASTIATIRQETQNRQPAQNTVAILADPVFGIEDERVATQKTTSPETLPIAAEQMSRSAREAGINWRRLPGTRQEADIVLGLVPEAERTQVFDFQANRSWATEQDLTDYQIIHLATHGFFDTQNPALSGIVLSLVDPQGNWQNGYLRLNEIFNLKLPAELIILSACQTALGDNIRGEGLVGITRGFMYAGTPRVMATLWRVDDAGTAELISRFYSKLLTEQLSPAAALRSAQIELWQIQRWRSPHFWAAFTFQGEWQ